MKPKHKTALVLAGGGLTGAVYEIGALRAIDDLLIDLAVTDFDIYIGTSAGALVTAFLANGVSPEVMYGVIDGSNKKIKSIDRQHLFRLNCSDYFDWGLHLPGKLLSAWSYYVRHIFDMTLFDLVWSFGETLPNGFYDGMGLESYIRKTLQELGLSNQFDDLQRELYIIATELGSGERAVFGSGYLEENISISVAASSAIPLMYKPVTIGNKDYIDGSMRGAASIDLAIERGAKLVVCINPMVPFLENQLDRSNENKSAQQPAKRQGLQSVTGQTLRIIGHAGLHYHVKQLRRAYPDVDIILIEPKAEDFIYFPSNMMSYSSRLSVARHGFELITLDLAIDYPYYREVLSRHDIRISRRLVIEELKTIAESRNDPRVVRKLLAARKMGDQQNPLADPIRMLSRTLVDLETLLDYPQIHSN